MISNIKPKLVPILEFVATPFMWLSPNVISFLSFGLSILFPYFLIKGEYFFALLSFLVVAFDSVDGTVARKTGRVTSFGGVLDSTLDRLTDAIMISAFAFASLVDWAVILPVLVASFLISYLRSRAELAANGKISLAVGLIERPERIGFLFAATFILLAQQRWGLPTELAGVNLITALFLILLVLSIFTVTQRFIASYERLAAYDKEVKNG